MLEAIAASLMTTAMRTFFASLFEALFGFLDKKQADADQRQLGRDEVLISVAKGENDAQKRAAKAAANNGDVSDMLNDLDKGKF